ncbi:Ribonuclease VapC33 [Anaerolineae bacterium]|nr:Ribonuclease VapC33 [Anaerolineae bacterium]
MILVDANLLIYAVNQDFQQHRAAREWWESTLSNGESVGIPWVVILAFTRICTNQRVFAHPLSTDEAIAYIDEWLDRPAVTAVSPGKNHWNLLRGLLLETGTGGNLTTDAHIAALALEWNCTVYTTDNDFKRFAAVRHANPLAQ